MAIDRFILRKLEQCEEENIRRNLLNLFLIRIEQAWYKEEAHRTAV
ncbi:hypothetical protein [Paenibacillus physcomitrellae]|uniref:Uncharacterized protein n=1 Tax=Paenibacillus physcomitrellae TaxID=1619311 RepID=A0ABQ1G8M0_9BACL|nr:hypothetical protein [Paenibacillus physcomitrellae]GGA38892.1 hypothetical protein GCM10010917_25170 [Paenibacillus physcomitrellae]